ncbi:hypothetical protein HK096_005301 [Nowakowskiella sp. JEL0078]|nr:hypothetical protein HK096_005301 [Nowakowskiella sp. JEL0078]
MASHPQSPSAFSRNTQSSTRASSRNSERPALYNETAHQRIPTSGVLLPVTVSGIGNPLKEDDILDLQLPKYSRFATNVASLTDRTRASRNELEKLVMMTQQLQNQCATQELECSAYEEEQKTAKDEVETIRGRIEKLMVEKVKIEKKLEELKLENDELESFLISFKQ